MNLNYTGVDVTSLKITQIGKAKETTAQKSLHKNIDNSKLQ